MSNSNILITGGAGFIGASFVEYFSEKYPDYHLINLDKLTYAGSLDNLNGLSKNAKHTFIKGDICDSGLVAKIFNEYPINGVIHFAAESHVDNSIKNPDAFVQTNINGTFNLLHIAYQHWFNAPNQPKTSYTNCRFHHISTDEVYGELPLDDKSQLFTENTPYAPSSPYSASKASSDMLVRAYHTTYGLDITISNCSNNYGIKQHQEKLIPTVIRTALSGNLIPIYGRGENIRDWLHVSDHCSAIDIIYHQGKSGETYNVGGKNESTNLELVKMICTILDELKPKVNGASYTDQISFVEDRPGHDLRYGIDATKLEQELGWKAKYNLKSGLLELIRQSLNMAINNLD
jgi:dTDP-glucose 4,6-dehydratase